MVAEDNDPIPHQCSPGPTAVPLPGWLISSASELASSMTTPSCQMWSPLSSTAKSFGNLAGTCFLSFLTLMSADSNPSVTLVTITIVGPVCNVSTLTTSSQGLRHAVSDNAASGVAAILRMGVWSPALKTVMGRIPPQESALRAQSWAWGAQSAAGSIVSV